MTNIKSFPGITKQDWPANHLLTKAVAHELDEVVIIGFDKEGDFYFASNKKDGPTVLWWLEIARAKLLSVGMG